LDQRLRLGGDRKESPMTDTHDRTLDGIAMIELVQRLGSEAAPNDYLALAESLDVPSAVGVAAYLAGLVVSIAGTTNFPLDDYIEKERADALARRDST
jgi:hypothetical protein